MGENLGRRIARMLPAVLVSASMLISATLLAVLPSAATAGETGGASSQQVHSRNIWKNEYSPEGGGNWAYTVDSALEHRSDGGYDRIEWANNALIVEQYSSSFTYVGTKTIDASTYTPTGATEVLWDGYFNGSSSPGRTT